jgi:UDP-N-acetylmuramoyl-tripeptide--D-alanyl-D-alanine ligase
MVRTKLIAITGSVGKSNAKDCLAAMMNTRFRVNTTPGTDNARTSLAMAILRTRFHHQFTIMEIGTKRPGAMARASWMMKPDAAIILAVAPMHSNRFPTLEHMAREKSQLLRRLTSNGLAVVNGEDPRVMRMVTGARYAVLTFGRAPAFNVWASDISARWPNTLRFVVHRGEEYHTVETNLVGAHWVNSILGALAAALAYGVPMEAAVQAAKDVFLHLARLQPVTLPNGAVVLRDECNASVTTYGPALEVLRQADARRRIAVVGDTWDSGLAVRERFASLGRQIAESADLAVFVGEGGQFGADAAVACGMDESRVKAIAELDDASEFLKCELREGDLVLLKSQVIQHFTRVYFALLGTVKCHKKHCDLMGLCDHCSELGWQPTPGNESYRSLRGGFVPANEIGNVSHSPGVRGGARKQSS